MAVQKKNINYADVVRAIAAGDIKPVYFLMGEESYYIDRISDYLVDTILKPEDRDFNLTVMYGPEISILDVLDAATRYPMMADRQVVVVKEAQALKHDLDELLPYLKAPLATTVLVFCCKHETLDARKKVATEIDRVGVLFNSRKLYDSQLPEFIASYLKRKKVAIDQKSVMMLVDWVGADLTRMVGELDKLVLALPAGQQTVTADLVEQVIGVSKEYNNFELCTALANHDILRVNKIAKYFDNNQKEHPVQVTLAMMYKFFSNLMLAYYAPDKSERGVMAWLDLKGTWAVRDYMMGMRNYSGVKVMNIISEIRKTDAKSKGVGAGSANNGELMQDLLYFILH